MKIIEVTKRLNVNQIKVSAMINLYVKCIVHSSNTKL